MHASKEELLAKIGEWKTKAAALEEESSAMRAAAEEEKSRLIAANSELNNTMHACEEELSAKIGEWETKVADAESASLKMKAAALLATQKAEADAKAASETAAKLKEVEVALEQMKVDAANLAAQQAEEKARVEAAVFAKEQAVKEEAQRAAEEKRVAKEKLASVLALSKIEFKYNSSQLTKKSEELLNSIFEIINDHPELTYDIQGHTDAHGNEDYNVKLSTSRAEKVKAYLVDKGISEDILSAQGFGSSMPIADNSTNEGRLQNRRVMITIVE